MKKGLLLVLIAFTLVAAEAQQAGRAKISFVGFRCMRETADDILHLDGKADEVFFRFYFTIAAQNGNMKLKYSNQSDTYGDAHGIFGNRVSAGSAVDLFGGLRGGIKGGDNYYCNNVIGEYDLAAGDVLTLVPTIWEWDPGNGYQNAFDATIDGAYATVNQKASMISNTQLAASNARPGAEMLGLFLVDAGHFLALKAVFNIIGELTPKPRPIGITTNGDYSPKAVLLNANVMQGIANSNFGYGAGVIPVQYNEEAIGNARDHGNYIILLKVEFTPSATSNSGYNNAPPPPPRSNTNTAPPPPPANTNTNAPPPATSSSNPAGMRKVIKPVTVTIDGVWAGTWGNADSNGPNQYSFRLNTDGTMQVIGANGAITANGSYNFSNNQLQGSYTYTGGGQFSFFATMDANGTLNGTWGTGSNARGSGKWIMNKAGKQATGNLR
jgi:hypothetical protein